MSKSKGDWNNKALQTKSLKMTVKTLPIMMENNSSKVGTPATAKMRSIYNNESALNEFP